jgi:3-deoxy-D-manno-octulosonic-acid transferase
MKNLVGTVDVKVLNLGDTRYDQVVQRAERKMNGKVHKLFENGFVFLGGSVWPQDVEKLLPALMKLMKEKDSLKIIMAPHEPSSYALEMLETEFRGAGFTTERLTGLKGSLASSRVILVDTVGVLPELYHHCDAAFVGGSFRKSIHNVMEPAVAGVPIFFGPIYHNSREAESLIEKGGAKSCQTSAELYNSIKNILENKKLYDRMASSARNVIIKNLGASARTVKEILES